MRPILKQAAACLTRAASGMPGAALVFFGGRATRRLGEYYGALHLGGPGYGIATQMVRRCRYWWRGRGKIVGQAFSLLKGGTRIY